jgi:hypothetical protein
MIKRAVLALVISFTMLLGLPSHAAAMEPFTICYYQGDARNSYGQMGALWYCVMYGDDGFFMSWYVVEPY